MILSEECQLEKLSPETNLSKFSCDNVDLDDFFKNDAVNYSKELLGVTYLFRETKSQEIVGFFTVSNASLNLTSLPSSKKKKVDKIIPHSKRRKSYPSVLLGRLGVSREYQSKGIGPQMLDFIKIWFRYENKTGCRFIIVDAYNEPKVLKFYENNDFKFLQPEEDEIEQLLLERGRDSELKTRHMIFDLARMEE